MNLLHPTDALFVASAHLDALRAAARSQEVADAATRRTQSRRGRSTRMWLRLIPLTRNVRQKPSEVFCPTC